MTQKILTVAAVLLVVAAMGISAQDGDDPTLIETLEWIEGALAEFSPFRHEGETWSDDLEYEISYRLLYSGSNPTGEMTIQYVGTRTETSKPFPDESQQDQVAGSWRFELSEVDRYGFASVERESAGVHENELLLRLDIRTGRQNARRRNDSYLGESGVIDHIKIYGPNRRQLQRLENAFNHAAELAREQAPESDEPF
mgnify:FL=1